jgi:hypothetical protein
MWKAPGRGRWEWAASGWALGLSNIRIGGKLKEVGRRNRNAVRDSRRQRVAQTITEPHLRVEDLGNDLDLKVAFCGAGELSRAVVLTMLVFVLCVETVAGPLNPLPLRSEWPSRGGAAWRGRCGTWKGGRCLILRLLGRGKKYWW